MKRLMSLIELIGSLLGFILLFGPPSWQGINQGIFIVLFIVILFAGGIGLVFLFLIARAQSQPPYNG